MKRVRARVRARPRGKRWIADDRRVWYLLLRIGLPAPYYGLDPARHIRVVRNELRALDGIVIRRIDLGCRTNPNAIGHYLFKFPGYKRDDAAATRLAEAFLYGMSLVGCSMIED